MREDIVTEKDGVRRIDIRKAIGGGYGNGWFTNFHGRYRFYVGARSTKKSYDMLGYEPVMKILSDARRNILVCRQNDSDNRQSTFERICGCISDLGLDEYFKINKNPLEITYKGTGQKIVFRGLNNPTSLNSITFAVGYLTDVYIEEAFEVSNYEDFRKLDGSLRGRLPEGLFLQITCCMNAWAQDCWIYHEFFKGRLEDDYEALEGSEKGFIDYKDESFVGPFGRGLYLHKSTYRINEFRDRETYDLSANEMKLRSPQIYQVEFLGMWGNATSQTYPEYGTGCHITAREVVASNERERCYGGFADFAIGIDTGFSNGEGKRQTVKRGEKAELKVKAATTMVLIGITQGYGRCVIVDEYFHSNDPAYNRVNTDGRESMTSVQLSKALIGTLVKWIRKYTGADPGEEGGSGQGGGRRPEGTGLMQGRIRCYVDSADIGFRQMLQSDAERNGLYSCEFMGSTKRSIQSRVDFVRYLMAYGDFLVCAENCPNTDREFRNSRKGERGEARMDGDDHCLTALEYGFEPMKTEMIRYREYKEH